MNAPIRLQLSRARGFDLQGISRLVNGLPAVNCARPGRFGNPFRVIEIDGAWFVDGPDRTLGTHIGMPKEAATLYAIRRFRHALKAAQRGSLGTVPGMLRIAKNIDQLIGKNLACWCKPGDPCHVDVLLDLARDIQARRELQRDGSGI